MFIATANSLSTIQPALRDRMEVIEINGYTIEEKVQIAKIHLLPKQIKEHGLKKGDVKISNAVLEKVVEGYTRESGVRGMDKMIAKLVRNAAKSIAMEQPYNVTLKIEDLESILGAVIFDKDKYLNNDIAGVVTGLAWTSVGGDILFIESSLSKGKGKLSITGNLGNVMKESTTLAMEYLRSHAADYDINPDVFDKWNVHVHVPEGATPKDGPSAGVGMVTSIISAITEVPVDKTVLQICVSGRLIR